MIFDIGCIPFPVTTSTIRKSVGSNGDAGFSRSRQVYERPVRVVTLKFSDAPYGSVKALNDLYQDTYGGIKAMTLDHPDGTGELTVRFADSDMRVTQNGSNSFSFEVVLEEVL